MALGSLDPAGIMDLYEAFLLAESEQESEAAKRAAARAAEEIAADIQPSALLEWAERYRRIDGQPFSLDRFLPLRQIYSDDHPHIVVIKPSQRGLSEWAINYALFALDRGAEVWAAGQKTGLNVGYIFPTQNALSAFSKERISGVKRESPYLTSLLGDSDDYDTVDFKQIRDSYLYLRGGWSETNLLSFAADVLAIDEYDRMDSTAIALGRRRLNASVVRREIDLSTPTLPGRGIHALYLQSDRHVYEQWHRCGMWVTYDFFRDVRVDGVPYSLPVNGGWRTFTPEMIRSSNVALACPSCQAPITDEERMALGRWRAEAPEVKSLRGYHVPWWPFPATDLVGYTATAVSHDPSEVTELFRSDLGQPYESSGSRVTEAMLAQLSHDLPGGDLPDVRWSDVTMGVDPGLRFHYRVSANDPDRQRCVLAMGSVGSWSELDGLMERYRVRQCVVDAMPELHAAQEFAARFPGRVLRAFYPTANALKGIVSRIDEANGVIQINRTMAMDRVFDTIARCKEKWPATLTHDREVVAHMKAPVRVVTTNDGGQEVASWVHTSPDHLFHACVYDLMAVEALEPEAPVVVPWGLSQRSSWRDGE